MALDTQSERRSAWQWLILTLAPVADGTIDDLDRQQAAFVYSGVDVGEIVTTPGHRQHRRATLIQRRRRWRRH